MGAASRLVKGAAHATLRPSRIGADPMRCLTLAFCLAALPASADLTYPGGRAIECYCTDSAGERVELGEETCLRVGRRSFMGLCAMSLNVPIWRDTGRDCLSS